jgi:glycosyltransferase involved in cell wall biosynthesis
MRILQVIEFFTPRMGGSAQVAYQTARHLARRGHAVTVWSSDYGRDGALFPAAGFELLTFPCRWARWGFYLTPALVGWARRHLRQFDVVHLHNVRTFQNLVVGGLAHRYGVPYVLSAHGSLPVIVERKLPKRVYDLLIGRRLLAGASRLIGVSPFEVQQYAAFGVEADRVDVVCNGLELDEFSDLPARGTLRQKLDIPDQTRVILYLGRLHRRKGIDHLIQVFARIPQDDFDTLLMIAGPDDGEWDALQALVEQLKVEERVIFTGPLYGVDKLAAYVDADLLASPAVHEVFGLVPFEALMCGTPVVVSDDGGSGQLIAAARAGFLAPYGDQAALATALHRVLNNCPEAQAQVRAGQAFVRRYLDWKAIAGELEALYTSLHCYRAPGATAGLAPR